MEVDDAQPVQEVFAELAGGDELVEIAIGGGDDADVDTRLRVVGPDCLYLAVLEKPQQQRLHPQAHLADFVEKERAAVRELELAALVAVSAGEAAFDVSEEFRLEERFGDAGAVHRHERRQSAAGVAVDISRDHVLAHSALACDQDLGGAFRRTRGHGEQFRHGRTGDDERWLLDWSSCGDGEAHEFTCMVCVLPPGDLGNAQRGASAHAALNARLVPPAEDRK